MEQPNILILGPPGAGKGTQSTRLAAEYDVDHVSTGDMLRQNKEMETPYGTPGEYMDAGELVPDEVMEAVVEEALGDAEGFVLDGYPRTDDQAEFLAGIADLDVILHLEVDREELVRRLTGRRVDPETGENYHVEFDVPEDEAVRERLIQREDDAEDVVRERLRVFEENTAPVIEFYSDREEFVTVDGEGSPEAVWERIREAVESTAE
jgi:adenylate kinase